MIYSCWGAAKQVTGSMHLLTLASGEKLLIDCGLDYEDRDDNNANVRFPFNPKEIDAMVLTHAHIDHSGNIPNLVKQGFQGAIYCTEPTAYHLESMWVDSVNIQNKKTKKGKPSVPKLFGYGDIKKALDLINIIDFYDPFDLQKDLQVEFAGVSGFGVRDLAYMRKLFETYSKKTNKSSRKI
jgi:metallo-beta-lactamase family protein